VNKSPRSFLGPRDSLNISVATNSYHEYFVAHFICNTSNPQCTKDNVYTALRLAPAPGVTLTEPVQNGDKSDVFPFGPVITYVTPSNYSIQNVTLPGHNLHPGQVTRQVVVLPSGNIVITTSGDGTGLFGVANSNSAESVWGNNALVIQIIVSEL